MNWNFPCGHPRKQYYERGRKVLNKITQEIEIKILKICKICTRRASNKNNRKYIKRKTNKRWKIVSGKRKVFYI